MEAKRYLGRFGKTGFVAVLALGTVVPAPAAADVFKFTGGNGVVTYTNKHRPGATRVKATSYIWTYTPTYARRMPTGKRKEYAELAARIASKYDVDPELVKAVIAVESGYDPNAVSPKGAQGLMQLIPATAERFGVSDPFDPEQNIEGGVKYLKFLYEMFDGNLIFVLAGYNAGENLVARIKAIPPFEETQGYVRKVIAIKEQKEEPVLDNKMYRKSLFSYVDDHGLVHLTDRRPVGIADARAVR